ncbi:hypothetical protein BKA83DRAFT_12139 [Pisolithus microcarpus]|nr:hypothetical protein BKA83DRAFT_12139 [Pisolithus microcarpus]
MEISAQAVQRPTEQYRVLAITIKGTLSSLTLDVFLSTCAGLGRWIVRLEACTVEIPDIELQLPPARGQLTTVEGLLRDIVADLSSDPPVRRILDEAHQGTGNWSGLVRTGHTKIQHINNGTKDVLSDEEVEDEVDEAGQVFLCYREEQSRPKQLPSNLTIPRETPMSNSLEAYGRSRRMRAKSRFGVASSGGEREGTSDDMTEGDGEGAGDTNEEIHKFMGVCSRCARSLIIRMKNVSIPYFQVCVSLEIGFQSNTKASFKDTLIMSTNCEHCEYRDNEVAVRKVPRRLEAVRRDITNAEKPFPLTLDGPLARSYSYAPDRNPNMEIVTYERKWQPNEQPGLNDMKVENYTAEDLTEVKRFEEVTS